jgi:hypothetical protein
VTVTGPPKPAPTERRARPDLIRWVCALVVVGVLSCFAFLLVTGRHLADGPVILRVTEDRGLHEGDLFVGVGWAVAVLAAVVLTLRRRGR